MKQLILLTFVACLAGPILAADDLGIRLEITDPGEVTATGPEFKVKANGVVNLSFTYEGRNLGRSKVWSGANTWLKIQLVWLAADGADVDVARAAQAFPPVKRIWEVADAGGKPVTLAVNASVPGNAVAARVEFSLLRDKPLAPASVTIRDIALEVGQVQETGIPVEITGPADAGPLSTPPAGVIFGDNLVPNGALEDGDELPTGWRVIGDNSGGAARWIDGGAYSGRHALRIDDRGPYRRSWGEEPDPEVILPGSEPRDNYGFAREEVYARWVSEPAPAEPDVIYQAMATVYWGYLDTHSAPMCPVRIQFLDQQMRPIEESLWTNGLTQEELYVMYGTEGWTPMRTRAVAAPKNAVWVRLVIVLQHAWYSTLGGPVTKIALNPEFLLVDNVALYRAATPRPANDRLPTLVSCEQAYNDTREAGGLPFIPTSPAHRPNSLTCQSHTPIGAGILEQGAGQPLGLVIRDRIGDRRNLAISYELRNAEGKAIHSGETSGTVEPYQETVVPLDVPDDLPLGPYTIACTLREGKQTAFAGTTLMAVAAKPAGTLEEHRRMDYPFATWTHMMKRYFNDDPARFALMGRVLRYQGVGKNGCVIRPSVAPYLKIADPAVRQEKLNAEIAWARSLIQALNEYRIAVIPMMHETPWEATPEDEPVIREFVTAWVNGLADLTLVWDHSDEPSAPQVDWSLIDATKKADGSDLHVWGYRASGRKFIEDYRIVYDAAHKAQPDVIFGFNTSSSANANVVHNLMKLDAKFDMLGCNMFAPIFTIWTEKAKALEEYGLADKVYLSGQNLGMPGAPEGDLPFAIHQTKTWVQLLQAFPMMAYAPQFPPGLDNNDHIQDERVKPAWAAYAAMTRLLGAGRFTAKHSFPGAEVYVRARSVRRDLVGVAWATSDNAATVELAVGAATVTVTDLWGNPRDVSTTDGVLTLALTDSPQYILGATTLEPAPSVTIVLAQASLDAARPQFTVTLRNEKPIAVGGVLTLDPQAAATVAPESIEVEPIAPGESRVYAVALAIFEPTLDQPLPIKARFATDDHDRAYESIQPLNFHFATRITTRPRVDAFLDDWVAPPPLALVADRENQLFKYQNKGPWDGPEALSGRLWMQWDPQSLYLAARVRDGGQTIAKDTGWLWAGDSIEMLIAPLGGGDKASPFTQIALGLVADGSARVMRYQGAGASGPLADARTAVRRVPGGYIYEAAVPWGDLTDEPTFTPKTGHAITAVFGFNDQDAGTRMISWFSHVTSKDPTRFGQIVLAGPASPRPRRNLVPNGDFDDPALPPADDLSNWRTTFRPDKLGNPSATAYVSRADADTGRCLVIDRLHDQNHAEVAGFRIPIQGGRRYLLRAAIKAPTRQPALSFSFHDAAGKVISETLAGTVLSEATDFRYNGMLMLNTDGVRDHDRFHPVAAVLTAPLGAVTINIGFTYNWSTGKACFDNVELFELALPQQD